MTITDILTRDRVIPELQATTKEGVLNELAGLLSGPTTGTDPSRLASVLRERERLNSTAIGEGIAIPHGRLPGLRSVVAGFARSPAGVEFDSVDKQPTHLFFVLVAPDDAAAMHLKALARISRLLKDKEFRARLLALSDRDQLYQAIVDEDARF
ncbi:MAG TPA: PTS sugar transporter subunit IIA [Candidatus Binatia bacterium]|nr:PTS sugar transporter subunit IIA [Candidatus Binatia bacterium]